MQAREIAFLALLHSLKGDRFIADVLEEWRRSDHPSAKDFNLAQEIAYGSCRMALALDYLARELTPTKKLSLKLKERAFLRIALYQSYFMDRIPQYAIADESIKIAAKYCHPSFLGFLNAVLRKMGQISLQLPSGNTTNALSIRYSYPPFFVEEVVQHYGLEEAANILAASNKPAQTMVRMRYKALEKEGLELIVDKPFPVALLKDSNLIQEIADSEDYYIQNITPATLIGNLAAHCNPPQRILDLCASPGGKTIAIHDFFPRAALYANDVSEEKLKRLSANFQKYHLDVHLSCGQGEKYESPERFDLIILDVPCSNSGVLNKRPEARWRLSKEALEELGKIQIELIKNARSLLAPEGEIWYMTCSILPKENEELIAKACKAYDLKICRSEKRLPNLAGWDGGFACALSLGI